MIDLGFLFASFLAGLITFLAPCTLPLVPAYLGFISGVDKKELQNPKTAKRSQRKIFLNGVAFILGFSLIFVAFGVLAGVFGNVLAAYQVWLSRIGGILVILAGLFVMGVLKISFLSSDKRLSIPNWLPKGRPTSSFLIGGIFALGWTPCVGPILGSILLLAGTSGTALEGGILLSVFSLGLALPFIFVALAFSRATAYVKVIAKYLHFVSIIGGIFLVLLGFLLLTGNFGLTIIYGFEIFDFLNYGNLIEYL